MGDIAIIGMACIFPGAADAKQYWRNIVAKVNSIGDPPPGWEAELYFDPESDSNDRIYCKRGGYLRDLAAFDPYEYGVMPRAIDGGEPDHYLALRMASEALKDAGYDKDTIDPERTGVIIGRGTYINRGVTSLFQHGVVIDQTINILKELHPEYSEDDLKGIKKLLKDKLPPFIPETTPSLVPNVLAGRIANRLNLMGTNYLVDAACASSLVAVDHGMRDLVDGRCDIAIVGGVNAYIPPPILMIFCQINALSRKQELKAFDEAADGTLLGEGLGFVVLKRKEDAVRDGDRIYSVLKSVGVASDGRVLGLLAPRAEGQALAMKMAYDSAGISPDTIGLVEAHGTGVPVGDITEIQSLTSVFGGRKNERATCALGTVKSMISHLIPAAGIAGLIKTSLALYHKVLPPTLCERPNPKLGLEKSPFYINSETRPWVHSLATPRRAAVNAFGFGGINAHAILEEYGEASERFDTEWGSEALLIGADSREALLLEIKRLKAYIEKEKEINLKDLAFTLSLTGGKPFRLSMVACSGDEAAKKLGYAADRLGDPSVKRIRDKSGIYYFEDPPVKGGKVAFLFPGEGSQYPDMLSDLCVHFPEVRSVFDLVDRAFRERGRDYLPSHTIFPLPLGQDNGAERLWKMDAAAESVFTASQALWKLMGLLKIKPAAMLGHSTGEYSALLASRTIDIRGEDGFIEFVLGVNSVYEELAKGGRIKEGALLTVGAADKAQIASVVGSSNGRIFVAMENCPNQVVLCGEEDVIAEAESALKGSGAISLRLPFARAYHTPLFSEVSEALRKHFDTVAVRPSDVAVYSCVTASVYPSDPDGIRDLATVQWASKVKFSDTIEAMYSEGVRTFIEVGPRGNLTAFVDDILRKKPHLALPSNLHRRSGLSQINELVALLYANHVPVDPSILYSRRAPVRLSLEKTGKAPAKKLVHINTLLPKIELGREEAKKFVTKKSVAVKEPSVVEPSQSPRAAVMSEYMRNMEEFLKSQEEIFGAFMSGGSIGVAPEKAVTPVFIDEVLSAGPNEAVAICRLDVERHRFLLDHTLGRKVSEKAPGLTALPVMPLTFSMELLAEGGSLLFPGMELVGMKEVRGYRWIGLDEGKRILQVHAKVVPGAREALVKISDADPDDPSRIKPGMPIVEGTMVFGEGYPAPPQPFDLKLTSARDSKWAGKDLYEGFMFHGPSLQAVESMEKWGENGVTASLRAMPIDGLFTEYSGKTFLSDPVILDAAGQVIAYWTSDHLDRGFHIFPFRLERLDIYGPCMSAPQKAECRAKIRLEGDTQVSSDIDILDGAGFLKYRLKGWWDRRFDMPESFFKIRAAVPGSMLSRPLIGLFDASGVEVHATIVEDVSQEFLESSDRIWERVLAHLVLGRNERAEFSKMGGVAKRRHEWLIGRAAVKDSVRMLSKAKGRGEVFPADIEIKKDGKGRPFSVMPGGVEGPSVTLAHSNGVAVAASAEGISGIGADIELVRGLDDDFWRAAFSEKDIESIRGFRENETAEWRMRAWCAKEAVAKALGTGLAGRQKELAISAMDRDTGIFVIEVPASFGAGGIEKIKAYTMRRGDFVLAGSIIR